MSNLHQNPDPLIVIEGDSPSLQHVVDQIRHGEPVTSSFIELAENDSVLLSNEGGLPAIHFKAPLKPKAFLHAPVIRVDLQHYQYPAEGHVVRVRVIVHDDVRHPYGFEIFLNPASEESRPALEVLTMCTALRIHLYPMNRKASDPTVVTRLLNWTEEQRRNVQHIRDVTAGCQTLWPAVIHRCAREVGVFS